MGTWNGLTYHSPGRGGGSKGLFSNGPVPSLPRPRFKDTGISPIILLLLFDVFEMQLRSANTFNTSTLYTKSRSDITKTRKQEIAQNCKPTLTGIELPLFVPPWDHQAQNTPYSTALGLPLQPLIPPFTQSAIAAMSYMSFFGAFPIYFLLFWIERL
jgi:hypothetical protein